MMRHFYYTLVIVKYIHRNSTNLRENIHLSFINTIFNSTAFIDLKLFMQNIFKTNKPPAQPAKLSR